MNDQSQHGTATASGTSAVSPNQSPSPTETDYLRMLGERVRSSRARRGMTRKVLARDSGVSERFLAQLESGTGNASILVLRQIANALDLPLDSMLPNRHHHPEELARSVELLQSLAAEQLTSAYEILLQHFGDRTANQRADRIALIGLRGAGKSTIGNLLASHLELPFFELDRLIEQESGVTLGMIFDMYGQSGFRRLERRCLEDLLRRERRFVLATGGSLVSEPATYERLLASCFTIWLRATPQEHMSRVVAQGDMRPMAHNPAAMSDLERILSEREALYAKADLTVDTSGRGIEQVLQQCIQVGGSCGYRKR